MNVTIKACDYTTTFECASIDIIHSEETVMLGVVPSVDAMANLITMRLPFNIDVDGNYAIEVKYTAITALKY